MVVSVSTGRVTSVPPRPLQIPAGCVAALLSFCPLLHCLELHDCERLGRTAVEQALTGLAAALPDLKIVWASSTGPHGGTEKVALYPS